MQTQMQAALELSRKLLSQARDGDWNTFEETLALRVALLNEAETEPATTREASLAIESMVQEIKTLDRELLALAEQHRSELLESRKKLSRSNKAITAYEGV